MVQNVVFLEKLQCLFVRLLAALANKQTGRKKGYNSSVQTNLCHFAFWHQPPLFSVKLRL